MLCSCCVTIFLGVLTMHLGLRRIPFAVFFWALPKIPRQQMVAVEEFCTYFLGRTMNRSNTYPQGLDEYSTGIQRSQNWGDGMLVRSKMLCWYQHCQAPTEWSMPMQPGLSGRSRVDTSAFASGKVTFAHCNFTSNKLKTSRQTMRSASNICIESISKVVSFFMNHTESYWIHIGDLSWNILEPKQQKWGILISLSSPGQFPTSKLHSRRAAQSMEEWPISLNAISVIYNLFNPKMYKQLMILRTSY